MLLNQNLIYTGNTYSYSGGFFFWGYSAGNSSNNFNKYSALNQNNSIPSGYNPHYTWAPAIKGNGLAMLDYGSGTVSKALLANAINLCNSTWALVGQGSVVQANLQNLVKMIATIVGTGSVTKADMACVLKLVATNITGTGSVSKADMGAIINLFATVNGGGGVNFANILGKAYMSAHIYVNESAATTEQLVDAIWEELVSDHLTPGSVGSALNDAGRAGNPWGSSTIANNDPGTFGELVQQTKDKITPLPGMIFGA
jgi:hypothetical protein